MIIKHPSSIIFFSPSKGGKTTNIINLCLERDKFFDAKIDDVYFFYNSYNENFTKPKVINFIEGLPTEIKNDSKKKIYVFDDFMSNKKAEKILIELATRLVHHNSITLIISVQDLFFSRGLRTVSINARLFFLFKNLRDQTSVNCLLSQIDLDSKFLKSCYRDATKKNFGYLCLDLQEGISPELRVSTDALGDFPTFYVAQDEAENLPLEVTYYHE